MTLKPIFDIVGYLKIFEKHLGKRMYLIFLLGIIASIFEGIGILMLLPLLESLSETNIQGDSHFINQILSKFINFLGLSQSIASILLLIGSAFIIKGILTFGALGYKGLLLGKLLKEIKLKIYNLYSSMDYNYYSSRNTGEFINIINEQPNRSLLAFMQLTNFGSNLINTTVLILLAFTMSLSFGIMSLIAGLILLMFFLRMNSYVQGLSRETANENGFLTKWLIQFLQGFKYLSSTNQTSKFNPKINRSITILTNNQIYSGVASAFTTSVREPVAVVLILIIIYSQLVVFQLNLEPIFVSIALFYRALNSTISVQAAFQATFDTIGSMELVDKEFKNQKKNQYKDGKFPLKDFKREIKFEDVKFKYNEESKNILDSINIEIPYKKSVALIGKSGSGKTTIVDMLTHIIKPQEGRILIDGKSLSDIQISSWRNQIGYVSQENVIFDDTIANNISMWEGTTDKISEHKIRDAAKKANILDFIHSLPKGLETKIGDRGVLLSGGQKQRIFIARELYRNPKVLILDEATSALDSESENRIQESVNSLQGHITLIIIAHRLSTIKNVDTIYLIDDGKIIESGTFDELNSNSNSKFKRLTKIQNL